MTNITKDSEEQGTSNGTYFPEVNDGFWVWGVVLAVCAAIIIIAVARAA